MDDKQTPSRARYMDEWSTNPNKRCVTCGEAMSQFLPGEVYKVLESTDRFINEGFSAFAKTDLQKGELLPTIETYVTKVDPIYLIELCEPCFHEENQRLSSMSLAARFQVEVVHGNITKSTTDAIVNAANDRLAEGGGVCGAIFDAVNRAGGHAKLTAACRSIGHCPTGDAVITPSFGLPAPWIIHAVGPVWRGRKWEEIVGPLTEGEVAQLRELSETYSAVLRVCRENGLTSVTVPAISTGIYGLPKELGATIARAVCARDAGDVKVTLIAYEEDSHTTLTEAPTAKAMRMLSTAGIL